MPRIQFSFETDTENDEPNQFILTFEGSIYETLDIDDDLGDYEEVLVGTIVLLLVQRDRIWEAKESLFEAMDSVDSETCECFEAIFDYKTNDWKQSIESLYEPDFVTHSNLLLIKTIRLEPNWQGKGIGSATVRHVVSIFGSSCGLICCKPFPLEYSGWLGSPGDEVKESSDEKKKREKTFHKILTFWRSLGFHQLAKSDFVIFSPEFDRIPKKKVNNAD